MICIQRQVTDINNKKNYKTGIITTQFNSIRSNCNASFNFVSK